jgi:HSP20 family molecular chaperone IbpA
MEKSFGNKLVDDGFEITLYAPGLDLDQIEINAYSSKLTVFIPATELFEEYNVERLFLDIWDVPNTKAILDRGILKILVPYNESKKPKRIDITKI